jgi:hypothetical protein
MSARVVLPLALLAFVAPAAGAAPILAAAQVLAAAQAAPAKPSGAVAVGWKEKLYSTDKLPPGMPAQTLAAIQRWHGFARDAGYRMDLDGQARVVLLTRADSSRAAAHLRVLAKAEAWFDAHLPSVFKPSAGPATGAKPRAPAPEPLPEDPEAPPPGATKEPPAAPSTSAKAWGSGSGEPDARAAVLIVLGSLEDHALLLEDLERSSKHLAKWIEEARKQTGLTLEDPLVGAYVEGAPGQEEWNGEHELVNRAVQMLVLRRFGQQPNWLAQGLAWEAEMAYDGSIWCYPYRDEFVFTTEHTSWPTDLRAAFRARETKPLAIEEVAGWKRGEYDAAAARLAWGLVRHLDRAAGDQPARLSALLEEFRLERDRLDRRATGPLGWERIPGWSMPPAKQEALLARHFGAAVLRDASDAFRGLSSGAAGSSGSDAPGGR